MLNYLEAMRIEAFLSESPMFAVTRAARRLEALAARALVADRLGFLESLVIASLFFEAPRQIKPSELAATFATARGSISHCISSLEAKGLVQRKIDPEDARAYLLSLKPQGRRCALRAIEALDHLQKRFEDEVGKAELAAMLGSIRKLDSVLPTKKSDVRGQPLVGPDASESKPSAARQSQMESKSLDRRKT